MGKWLKKIVEFIKEHHLLSLCTCRDNLPHSASCFYAFDEVKVNFIIASKNSTRHIKELNINSNYAGVIALETKEVRKIRGLQFSGVIKKATLHEKALYIKTFIYALAMNPTLWTLHVKTLKFTDNRSEFKKKSIYKREDERSPTFMKVSTL
ncbi:MAG: pyridoxamine 5'-phosphate oxidase family protein [Sulfurospirillum sp.]|nr:pyridoxamine 5'-phosphate oxidase family protein [Sulfurospirillum sp.]MBL0703353.1 pyridoxamine 5'-phosphate oxidase family protein [Sulfurospirillum sp.]